MAKRRDGEKGPDESGLKPSLATTTAKASERVIVDPPSWDVREGLLGYVLVFRVSRNTYQARDAVSHREG